MAESDLFEEMLATYPAEKRELARKTDPNNAESNLDGILDGWDVLLGLNPHNNNVATQHTTYSYTLADWLNGVYTPSAGWQNRLATAYTISTLAATVFSGQEEMLPEEIGATGRIGEEWLAQNLGGESQVYFSTSQGARYVDQLANGIANESKVGYQSLTPNIQLQISKDAELLNAGRIEGVNWHFFQSPATGLGGPSQPLMNALQQNGVNVIIH